MNNNLIKFITEPNLRASLEWASEIGLSAEFPESLEDKKERAKLIYELDPYFGNICVIYTSTVEEKEKFITLIVNLTRKYFPNKLGSREIVNVVFRLWAGCISAAKTIGYETRSGLNTKEKRQYIFQLLDSIAKVDGIFRKGVETAKYFKELRKQPYSFKGVPLDSPVRG